MDAVALSAAVIAVGALVALLIGERREHLRTRAERDAARADAETWMGMAERWSDDDHRGGAELNASA